MKKEQPSEEEEEDELEPSDEEEVPVAKKPKLKAKGKEKLRVEAEQEVSLVHCFKKYYYNNHLLIPNNSFSSQRLRNAPESEFGDIVVRSTSQGEKYLDLGKKKRATVRTFKGNTFVDIREFYAGPDGDEKPGKKGVSLGLEQVRFLFFLFFRFM